MFLTEAGEMFIDYAKNTLTTADEGKARMQDLANIHTGKLRIGITHAFTHMMTDVVPEFCKRYPNIEIEIRYKTVEELLTMLCAHELDLVLCYKPIKLDKRIVTRELYEDRLGIIMRSDHSLAGRKSVSVEEISKYQFALPSRGLHARTRVEGIFAKHGVKPKVCVDLNVSTTLLGFVRKSKMLSMLACRAVDAYPDLCAVPIEDPDNGMTACIHTLKGAYCKHAQKEFETMNRSWCLPYVAECLQQLADMAASEETQPASKIAVNIYFRKLHRILSTSPNGATYISVGREPYVFQMVIKKAL